MPLFIDALLAIIASLGNAIIMLLLLFWVWRFWRDLREGANGITGAIMLVFFALANSFLFSAVATGLWFSSAFLESMKVPILIWRILCVIFIIFSFIVLHIEFKQDHEKHKNE